MPLKIDPISTKSLTRQIADRLREAIMRGELGVDERLPTEHELAARFQVSRPTIREALKRLAAQNLIRSQRCPTGGTFVTRPSRTEGAGVLTNVMTLLVGLGDFDLEPIAEARHQLEDVCARLAVKRRTREHLERLRAEVQIQKDPELSDEAFCASDVRFHRALVDASGNPVLGFLMHAMIEALQPIENMVIFRFRDRRVVVNQHEKILAALEAGRARPLVLALDEQMEYLREKFAEAQAWRRERDAGSR